MIVKPNISIELEVMMPDSDEKRIVKKGSIHLLKLELKSFTNENESKDTTIETKLEVVDIIKIDTILKTKGKKSSIESKYEILFKIVKLDTTAYLNSKREDYYRDIYIDDIIRVPLDDLFNNQGVVKRWKLTDLQN